MGKLARRGAFTRGIERLARQESLRMGTVWSRTNARRVEYRDEWLRVYGELVRLLDDRMRDDGQRALVVMDGDGTATGYLAAHRALRRSTRHVVEDPLFQHSHRSHWLQMADMVAYSAYQEVLAHPSKQFAHGWYPRLREHDLMGGPMRV